MGLAIAGACVLACGVVFAPERTWSNLFVGTYFLLTIGLGGAVFVALTYVTGAGWHRGEQRETPSMDTGPRLRVGLLCIDPDGTNARERAIRDGTMISQTVDYSLRAMVALASYYNQVLSVREIAAITKVPCPYLSKLMRQLVRAELVRSRRGVGGGFMLARPPADISIWDVVEAIAAIGRPHCCPLNIAGHSSPCALHRLLNHAIDEMEQAFCEVSLADILADCSGGKPIQAFSQKVERC